MPNHGDGLVIWNFDHTGATVGNHYKEELDFWQLPEADQKYGFLTAIDPVIIGYRWPISRVNLDNVAYVEDIGVHVYPPSLFEHQIGERLGKIPSWMSGDLRNWNRLSLAFAANE